MGSVRSLAIEECAHEEKSTSRAFGKEKLSRRYKCDDGISMVAARISAPEKGERSKLLHNRTGRNRNSKMDRKRRQREMNDVTVYRIVRDRDGNLPTAFQLRQQLKKQCFNQVRNVELTYLGKWDDLELLKQAKD